MWEKIKKILSKGGGKCVIIENEESYVIVKWENYEKMIDTCFVETQEANRNIDHWKAEENAKSEPAVSQVDRDNGDKAEVKIEDLPF